VSELADEALQDLLQRLSELSGQPVERLDRLAKDGPHPEIALLNLERWLRATSSPMLQMERALGSGPLLDRLLTLIGTSQVVSDLLVQNPELASLILDPEEVDAKIDRLTILSEGRGLLAAATGFAHALDRLRFLKQRWTLPIVVHDVFGTMSQPQVWQALSDLADALIELAADVVWRHFAIEKGIEGPHRMTIVGFGKLGGGELNYSSDVDLVYVSEDGAAEKLRSHQTRFAEALGRALSDRTGRGSLYRVDLRLRPYGGGGPLVPSFAAVEAYYEREAEPWEIQALLRTRVIVGSPETGDRWEALRLANCFRPAVSEIAISSMLAMRERIGDYADDEDFKRGRGGIRDVEFIVQILQLAHGREFDDVRVRPTLDALAALKNRNFLNETTQQLLAEGYTFLRRLEHRCQLLGDRQTHRLPHDPSAMESVARLMDIEPPSELERALDANRRTIEALYASYLKEGEPPARIALRSRIHTLGASWLDAMPESEAFYAQLLENEGSLDRVERIVELAPALIPGLRNSVSITEAIFSGEIEEEFDPISALEALPTDCSVDQLAHTVASVHTRLSVQWVLDPTWDLGEGLTSIADATMRHVMRRLYVDADFLALGSYGRCEIGLHSDLDALFLIDDPRRHAETEMGVQQLLALVSQLHRHGSPFELDLRLRPDGGKGLLVRSYEALKAYDLEGMDLWERFAIGQVRLVVGTPRALEVVRRSAYGLPLTPERLGELAGMKRRIENERVKVQHRYRDIKLGRGGLGDIEWFVHILEMRYPTALNVGTEMRIRERIRRLGEAKLVNAIEAEELNEAYEHLVRVRHWLAMQGIENAIVPENPDKLNRLAAAMGLDDSNSFLRQHEAIVTRIRQIYEEGMARLRA
jgi:glutamate-ammonia-ligase adenylyltransferase